MLAERIHASGPFGPLAIRSGVYPAAQRCLWGNVPMPGPLAGIRVLDLSTVLVGPYCTHVLAEMGAEVTKVEAPEGDVVRLIGPGRSPGMGCMFITINR